MDASKYYGELLRRRVAGRFVVTESRFRGGTSLPTHSHPSASFTFTLKGSYRERYGTRWRTCVPGTVIGPPANERHSQLFDGSPRGISSRKRTARNLTVIVDIHGGPEEQDRAWFYPWAQYLASRGYGLLDPNIRGSTGYGRTYLHMADGRKRENAVKDVAALRTWLIASGGANPKAIFVNGASYGGYVVLSCLYHYPAAWAGGIDVYGVADWVDFLEKTGEDRANRQAVYGSLAHDRAFLASISPDHIAAINGRC